MDELHTFLNQIAAGETAAVGVAIMLTASFATWLAITARTLYRLVDTAGRPWQTALVRIVGKQYHPSVNTTVVTVGDIRVVGTPSAAEYVTITVAFGGREMSGDFRFSRPNDRGVTQLANLAYARYVTGRLSKKPHLLGITPT